MCLWTAFDKGSLGTVSCNSATHSSRSDRSSPVARPERCRAGPAAGRTARITPATTQPRHDDHVPDGGDSRAPPHLGVTVARHCAGHRGASDTIGSVFWNWPPLTGSLTTAVVDGVALLKHTVPLENLSVGVEFERPLILLVARADAIEHELTQSDQF